MVRKLGVRATDTYEMCLLMFFFKTTTLEPYANAVTVSISMHIRCERLADAAASQQTTARLSAANTMTQ